ncbi:MULTISPECIES: glycosyltransferase [unclassified Pseudomonas]|uniref:glycosyltransferase family 2 protein n=1 Tax=unclassified Pseudomonas TaxID=196821 RepID=UPI000A1F9B41|nr:MULTISPECIES: glycosyltransferase [unclassified Pseudomonas]
MPISAGVDAHSLDQALMRLRLMYAKPEHPYYILAPDYRETSSGVASLHYLCHVLNLNGREAYICSGQVVNPNLKTPLLDPLTQKRHRDEGKVPVAVYPEVVVGNPLGCDVVARFLLNFEGFLTGKSMQAAGSDLLFYSGALIAARHGYPDGDLLCLPTIDVELFSAPAPGSAREGKYLYQNRHPLERIDYSQLPDDIRLLSMSNALSLPELAVLLRKAEVLYTHEWSMTCVIAVLCGCPVIFIPGHGIDQAFLDASFMGSQGFAMLDQPDAFARASAGVQGGLQRYVERTAPFWQHLEVFIAKTQLASRRESAGNRAGVLGWLRQRYPLPKQLQLMQERLTAPGAPSIAVLVLDHGDPGALARTLGSLDDVLYQRIQVCVLGATEPRRPNVQWQHADAQAPLAAINGVLESSPCDWCMVVDAGAEFTASGLLVAALDLAQAPVTCLAVFADEAVRGADGGVESRLRPDFNLDLLLAYPAALSRHWLYGIRAVLQQGGFEPAAGRAFELAYQLRLVTDHGFEVVGHINEPLLIANPPSLMACDDERAVIQAHLLERGYSQALVRSTEQAPNRYRIDYGHPQPASVSVLVYVDGDLPRLQRCVEQLLGNTEAVAYEVLLIEPGNDDPLLLQWLEMLCQVGQGRVQVLRFMAGQARAAMCNAASQEAQGEFLVWLDAATMVSSGDWLQTLLNHAQRPEVGAVGCMLSSVDGVIQQAGLVLGLGGSAGPAYAGQHLGVEGDLAALVSERNGVAVGDRCLMIRRATFLELGGFTVDALLEPWIEVDLCLRLQQAGYLNVWTPRATVLLQANAAAAVSTEQEEALYARWLPQLVSDPAYNANLSLLANHSHVRQDNGLCWRPLQGIVPTVLAFAADQQSAGQMRVIQPLMALRNAGAVDGSVTTGVLTLVDIERYAPSTVVLQRPLADAGLLTLRRLRAFSQAFKVYDLDGYIPEMGLAAGLGADELLQRLSYGLMHADRVIVATPALAELLQGQHDDVRLIESALPASWGQLQGLRGVADRPRLGWIANKDATLLAEVIPAMAEEVDWVVLGDCPQALRPFVREHHPMVPDERLGNALVALNLDLALVPMADTLGNACSGDLRVLQHAACAHPVICSRVAGFVGASTLPLSKVENETADWLRAIRLHLEDRSASAALGDALQNAVRSNWLLEGERLEIWRQAWLA